MEISSSRVKIEEEKFVSIFWYRKG